MSKLGDILSSDFFKDNIQTEMDAEDRELEASGWTRAEIESVARLITK